MISNFERDTVRLSGYEKNELMPVVIEKLKTCVGKRKVITNKKLIRQHLGYYVVDPARLRKVINYIRVNGIIPCVASSNKGFFVASNEIEISECISTLEALADSIQEVIEALRRQMYNKFRMS